jgi:hypothetical protein
MDDENSKDLRTNQQKRTYLHLCQWESMSCGYQASKMAHALIDWPELTVAQWMLLTATLCGSTRQV